MGKNIVQKIIDSHLVSGELTPGTEVGIAVDHTLIQDATGTMAMLQFEAIGAHRVKTKRSLAYVDHNTLQIGFESMDDHLYLQSACQRYGLYFCRAGNGICHQVNLERFSVPGETLLGADSHTTTCGGVGMLAIGAGGLDVAVAMAGLPFYFTMPQVVKVELRGELPPWSTAKDVILELLRRMTVSGGRGKVLEFAGPGVRTLNATQRATIANMTTELGALTAVFPSDKLTLQYFRAQGRENEWREVQADRDAAYDQEIVLDLTRIEPLMARSHSPDHVVPVRAEAGRKVDQVAIGSCTNSSLEDMLKVAAILRGRKVPPGVSLVVAPGSRQVLQELAELGALAEMIGAGVRVLECACGPCVGIGQAPCSGGVSLRTFNRNFRGRSGTPDALVYLVSPETAAASALRGVITDPRDLGAPVRPILPERFHVDDGMIVPPAEDGAGVEIIRGPNIKPLPELDALPNALEGEVLLRLGDDVTTDDILPGGAKIMALRSNIPAISQYVFGNLDPEFVDRAKAKGGGFLVAGKNYGQGSSREHAALAPRYLGIRGIIAESFSRIHKANLVNFGILPIEISEGEDMSRFSPGDRVRIGEVTDRLRDGEPLEVENLTRAFVAKARVDLTDRLRRIVMSGGLLAYTRSRQ